MEEVGGTYFVIHPLTPNSAVPKAGAWKAPGWGGGWRCEASGGFIFTKPLLLATLGSAEVVGASLGMAILVLRAAVDAFRTRMEQEHPLSW